MRSSEELRLMSNDELDKEIVKIAKELDSGLKANPKPLDQGKYPEDFDAKINESLLRYYVQLKTEKEDRRVKP